MKLVLFSHGITKEAGRKICKWVGKKAGEIKVSYITTPVNPRGFKPEWCIETENQIREFIGRVEEFDVEQYLGKNFNFGKYFSNRDIIFISGGNTFYVSYWMKEVGAEKPLKKLINEGKVIYAGESAGIVYLMKDYKVFKLADKPKKAPEIINEGLGLINFAPLPHWGGEKYGNVMQKIEKTYQEEGVETVRLTDGQAMFIKDGRRLII
jgi:dipeptidase E